MDFRDWKKTKEDKNSCTLIHPKGHTMTIAVKALPRIHQEQIKRLAFAEGGKVDMSEQGRDVRHANKMKKHGGRDSEIHMELAKEEARGRAQMERTIKPKIKGLANGGEVPVGMPDPQKAKDAWDGAQNGQMNRLKELVGMGDKKPDQKQAPQRQGYAGGTPDHPVTADEYLGDDEQAPADKPGNAPITINVGAPPPVQQSPPPPVQPPGGQIQPMKAPVSAAFRGPIDQPPSYKVNPPAKAPELLSNDQTPSMPAVMDNQQQALQEKSEIEKAQAHAAAQSSTNLLMNQEQLAKQQAQDFNEIHQATDAFKEYVNKNPINPKSYQENQSSGQKTATAIGLVLGGLGQGFWGGKGNNPAMDFLNKQIDRDIDAQKSRTEQQKTVYGYYHNLYGDSVVANNLARISMNDMYTQELVLQAARSGDQMAAVRAKEAANDFAIKNNDLFVKTAGRLGILRTGGGGGTRAGAQGQPQQQPLSRGAKKPDQASGNPVYKILTPDADQKALGLQYGPNAAKEKEIQAQYQQAAQAEKLLNGPKNDGVGGVSDLLKQMHNAAKKSGIYGHLHRTAGEALEQIPFVGPAAGAASSAVPATESENIYNNAQVQIETDMATALKDIMTPTEIHKLVQKISPTLTDTEAAVKNKEKTLVNSVTKAVRGKLLEQAKMIPKEK